jgi:hypothetical protein
MRIQRDTGQLSSSARERLLMGLTALRRTIEGKRPRTTMTEIWTISLIWHASVVGGHYGYALSVPDRLRTKALVAAL